MNPEQQKAYEWAKNQNYQSVAAQYAKILADLIYSLQADLARVTAERDAAVRDVKRIFACGTNCVLCKKHKTCQLKDCKIGFCAYFEWRGSCDGVGGHHGKA